MRAGGAAPCRVTRARRNSSPRSARASRRPRRLVGRGAAWPGGEDTTARGRDAWLIAALAAHPERHRTRRRAALRGAGRLTRARRSRSTSRGLHAPRSFGVTGVAKLPLEFAASLPLNGAPRVGGADTAAHGRASRRYRRELQEPDPHQESRNRQRAARSAAPPCPRCAPARPRTNRWRQPRDVGAGAAPGFPRIKRASRRWPRAPERHRARRAAAPCRGQRELRVPHERARESNHEAGGLHRARPPAWHPRIGGADTAARGGRDGARARTGEGPACGSVECALAAPLPRTREPTARSPQRARRHRARLPLEYTRIAALAPRAQNIIARGERQRRAAAGAGFTSLSRTNDRGSRRSSRRPGNEDGTFSPARKRERAAAVPSPCPCPTPRAARRRRHRGARRPRRSSSQSELEGGGATEVGPPLARGGQPQTAARREGRRAPLSRHWPATSMRGRRLTIAPEGCAQACAGGHDFAVGSPTRGQAIAEDREGD